jgi:hypothetical protein
MKRYICLALLGAAALATAAPTVSYSVSGTSGDYTLDFSVYNNMFGTSQDIYFFGVQLGARNITGSPTDYDPNVWPTWNNASYGGSSTIYNNNWIDLSFSQDAPGQTVSGFDVTISDLSAPTSVQYFLYGYGSAYKGGDNFNTQTNPGFEGVASNATPEPAPMFGLGLGVIGLLVRRKRK